MKITQNPEVMLPIIKERLDALQKLKSRKRGAFKSKCTRYSEVIFILKDQYGASYQEIALYLWKHHRFKVTRENLCYFYLKIRSESERVKESESPDYWGDAGQV